MPAPEPVGEALLKAAKTLHRSLAVALRRSLAALRSAPAAEDVKKAADRAALIAAHGKSLHALLDLETRLDKDRRAGPKTDRATGCGALDLDAARLEVARRLDRLAARAAPSPLVGGVVAERAGGAAVPLGLLGARRSSTPPVHA